MSSYIIWVNVTTLCPPFQHPALYWLLSIGGLRFECTVRYRSSENCRKVVSVWFVWDVTVKPGHVWRYKTDHARLHLHSNCILCMCAKSKNIKVLVSASIHVKFALCGNLRFEIWLKMFLQTGRAGVPGPSKPACDWPRLGLSQQLLTQRAMGWEGGDDLCSEDQEELDRLWPGHLSPGILFSRSHYSPCFQRYLQRLSVVEEKSFSKSR